MKLRWRAQFGCVFVLSLAACGQQSEQAIGGNEEAAAIDGAGEENAAAADIGPDELPPMIERSPSYRCTDGDALYVDVLTDENSVMVRDSRTDVPVRLTRESAGQPFAGEERTLSGTGSQVTYSSPERPNQRCTEAES